MPREKPYFRDVVADIHERTGKMMLNAEDIRKYLRTRRENALNYLEGEKTISVYKFASKLL